MGEEENVADYGEAGGTHDEWCAEVDALGEYGDYDREDECHGVGRDGEQLGLSGGVSELLDDRGL